MVKKRVPDWLNNSLWSSTTPADDDRLLRYAPKTTTTTITNTAELPTETPVPEPPPETSREEPPKPEITDRPSYDDENSSNSSAEDISRQAQILTEVSICISRSLFSSFLPSAAISLTVAVVLDCLELLFFDLAF